MCVCVSVCASVTWFDIHFMQAEEYDGQKVVMVTAKVRKIASVNNLCVSVLSSL